MKQEKMQSVSHYIYGLDGLRAIAILMIFAYHLKWPFVQGGLLGVPVFFVLSGYLITRNLTKEIKETGTFNFGIFWAKRIRRLVPLILTVTSFSIIVSAIFNRVVFTKACKDLISAIFCFNNWWQIFNKVSYFENAGAPSPLTHFWALAVEVQFYLVFPLLVYILSKFKNKEKLTLGVVAVLTVISAVLMAVLFHPGQDPSRVYYGTDTRLFSFLLGAILAFVTGAYRTDKRIPESMPDTIGIPSFFLLMVMMCVWDGHSNWLYRGGYVLVSILAVVVVYTVLGERSILGKVLSLAPLKWIGDRSYSIYLWHFVIITIISGGKRSAWYIDLIEIVLSIVIAAIGYALIETPVRQGAIGKSLRMLRKRPRTEKGRRIKARKIRKMKRITYSCIGVFLAVVLCVAFVPRKDVGNIAAEKQSKQDEADEIAKEKLEQQKKAAEDKKEEKEDAVSKLTDEEICENENILLIGDSIALDVTDYFYEIFPNSISDCEIGRGTFSGPEVYNAKVADGWSGDAVIYELGSNGPLTYELDEMRELLDPEITMYVVSIVTPYDDFWDANNQLIREFVQKNENTYLIDWDEFSSGHSEYFDADEEHLLPDGAKAYAQMIKEAVVKVNREKPAKEVSDKNTSEDSEKKRD